MRRARSSVTGVLVIMAVLLANCNGANDKGGGGGGGNMTCTPRDGVQVQTGFGVTSQSTCTQISSSFNLNAEVWGCTEWDCLGTGDVVKLEWRRPNGSLLDHDFYTYNGTPHAYNVSANTRPDVTGQWSLRVFRNGGLVASVAFGVR